VGYVGTADRLVWWHPAEDEDPVYVRISKVDGPADGVAAPGSIWSWVVDGTGPSAHVGSFKAAMEVIEEWP